MWGRFIYREIERPRSIVWLNSFSNDGCGITRAPFNLAWPLEMLNAVTLAEQAGKTALHLRAQPFGANEAERAVFQSFFESLKEGFGGTMDQLAAYLAKG
jgi:uncharacterized protein YndB with AHSA1/START domain